MPSWILLGAVLLAGLGRGAELPKAPGLTLRETLRLACENHPELKAADARVQAAAGAAQQALAWPNPELEVATEELAFNRGAGFPDAKHTIGFSQTIPYQGRRQAERQAGQARVQLAGAERARQEYALVREVKAAFWKALAAERQVQVSRDLADLAESSADTARKRFEAGAAAQQERVRARLQLETARLDLTRFEGESALARMELLTLLGRTGWREVSLEGELSTVVRDDLMAEPAAVVMDAAPEVRVAMDRLEVARQAERRARLETYPDFKAGLAGGRIGATDESVLEFRVSVPLPLFDRSQGRRLEAQAGVAEAEAGVESARRCWRRDWALACERYRAAGAQAAGCRERVLPRAEEALRLVEAGFEAGKFGFMDLLDTQRTLAETRLAYQQKLLALTLAEADLETLLEGSPVSVSPPPQP